MTTDLAPILLALQDATGIRVLNGQITLHVGNGTVQKVDVLASQRPSQPVAEGGVDKPPRRGA